MFVSPNIPYIEVERLSGCMGFQMKKKLGRYLGHIIVQDGKNREHHKELLHRAHARLEGWKLSCLSRAGSLTLAQSVMGSLPIFHMQLEQLPSWLHKEINKATQKCVWRMNKGGRGVHLLSWEVLGKPKKQGGANLKLAKDVNHALLAKLA